MLKKELRLSAAALLGISRIRPLATARGALLTVKAYPATLPFSRFAVVIGKKVDARATARNRIKRWVFDFFAVAQNAVPVREYVCIVQPQAATKTKIEVYNELSGIFHLSPAISHKP